MDDGARPDAPPDRRRPWARLALTLLGVAAVFYGAFQPAVDVRLYGPISFVEVSGLPGKLMLLFAVLVLAAATIRSTRFKLAACVAMWAALLWPLLEGLMTPDEEAKNLFHAAGRLVTGTVGAVVDTAKGLVARALVTWTDGVTWMVAGCALVTFAAVWALLDDIRHAVRRRRARKKG
jgi:hypothetical protein